WEAVLQVEPGHMEALQHLLRREIENIEQSAEANPITLQRLEDFADKILKAKPDHAQAKAYKHIAVIAKWLGQIVTPDEVLKDNMEALARLQKEDRTNPDVPYYLAMALVRQPKELRTSSQ